MIIQKIKMSFFLGLTLTQIAGFAAPSDSYKAIFDKENDTHTSKIGLQCLLKTQKEFLAYESKIKDPDLKMSLRTFVDEITSHGYFPHGDIFMAYEPAMEKNLGPKFCFLNRKELATIEMYVNSFYITLNDALHGKKLAELKKLRIYVKHLNSALDKLKNYDGYVKRGSSFDSSIIDGYVPGASYIDPTYLSTSIDYGWGGNILYVIKSNNCKYIAPFSLGHEYEEEVLCKPGTQYEVLYHGKEFSNDHLLLNEKGSTFNIDQLIQSLEKK
jgi:ADP-ribosyltransferase exoenzyme